MSEEIKKDEQAVARWYATYDNDMLANIVKNVYKRTDKSYQWRRGIAWKVLKQRLTPAEKIELANEI